ncbi:MAG: hypothetical protein IJH67_14600 [Thermoguttaceae bacterium]|nr:hypothetical protein [Thermoguttaceae bacterium]
MHSVNRFFTLFVVLAVFASARSFGGEFTPMTTLFQSGAEENTELKNSQLATRSSQKLPEALPNIPEDIQFPEPTNDVDLTLLPAPPSNLENREQRIENRNSSEAISAPHSSSLAPNSLATRNSQQATNSIEQVGFYLPEQSAIPSVPRSTLPDPSLNDITDDYLLVEKPKRVYVNTIAAAPQSTSIPADVKAIVETPVENPVENPFAQEPAVGLGSRQEAVGSSNYPLATRNSQLATNPQAAPLEPVIEGSNPQFFREDFDYQQFRSEILGEIDKRAWRSGNFQIIPYGKLWASMSYETKPTQIGAAPFFVTAPSNTGKQAHVDYRGTILGANVKAPGLLHLWDNFNFNGKVEFDLQRTIDFDNKTTVHLRHCYVEAISDEWRILIGQTWDVVSPLAPGTLMYSAGWMDGNVGYRRAQFRLERFINVSPCFQWKLQGCLSAPFAGDSNSLLGSDYRLKYGSWPIVQGRIAAVLGNRRCLQKPMEIGFAAHIGELQYGHINPGAEDTNYTAKTWGMFLDAYIPITCRFGVQGELFKGENLAMFLGGINQGVMRSAAGTPESIAAQGGWINLWFNLNDYTQFRVGYMIDDPQGDIDEIPAGSALQARTLNHSLFANIKCDITKMWWVGLEYSHVETSWTGKETGVSACDRVDFVSYFSF